MSFVIMRIKILKKFYCFGTKNALLGQRVFCLLIIGLIGSNFSCFLAYFRCLLALVFVYNCLFLPRFLLEFIAFL
jgi:hypothetical protein